MAKRRDVWTLLAGAMLTMTVAVAGAQGSGACNRQCLIGLTEAYLSAMVARDPAKAPVTASVRVTQNTRPMSLGQGVWESIKGVRGYKLLVTDPAAGQVALYTVVDGAERPGLLTLRMKVEEQRISEIESVYVGIGQTGFGSVDNRSRSIRSGPRPSRPRSVVLARRWWTSPTATSKPSRRTSLTTCRSRATAFASRTASRRPAAPAHRASRDSDAART